MVPDREKLIGARLRAFREMLQIPRSKFAVAIGFGSERIASYESGRAALPWVVFKAVSDRYYLSASWLAGHGQSPKFLARPIYPEVPELLPGRMLFSKVFDDFVAAQFAGEKARTEAFVEEMVLRWEPIKMFLEGPLAHKMNKAVVGSLLSESEKLVRTLKRYKSLTKAGEKALSKVAADSGIEIKALTPLLSDANNMDVTATHGSFWKTLQARLRRAVAPRGSQTALARALGVTPSAVAQWLSEKESTRPIAETALKLLNWVEQQEAKSKSPGSMQPPPEPKTQVPKSKIHEKKTRT